MTYKVINCFKDTQDNNTVYEVGEQYPKGDYEPSSKRVGELLSIHPKYKRAFIEEVKENNDSNESQQPVAETENDQISEDNVEEVKEEKKSKKPSSKK